MKVYNSIIDLIGNTPLLELRNIKEKFNLKSNIYAKLESYNPGGSIKDRVAYKMILDLEERGLLKKNSVIIEPTSGNTGIGIALIGVLKGYRVIIVMPSNMSIERIKLMEGYGAEVVLTDAKLGMQGSIDKANELNKEITNSVILGQFTNSSNPMAHYKTTAKEIYDDLDGNIDIFIAGIGTGGTISGIGKYLKEKNSNIKIIGIEPSSSPLISKNIKGSHKIQGIGANFIPPILNKEIYDEIRLVDNEDAFTYSKLVMKLEGVLVGVSSGAALKAAIEIAKENENKNIVVIFPDTGYRYLSTELFDK